LGLSFIIMLFCFYLQEIERVLFVREEGFPDGTIDGRIEALSPDLFQV